MKDTTSEAMELRLRAALGDLRPTDGASASLRARVDGVPGRIGSRGIGARIRGIAGAPALFAAVAFAAAMGLVARSAGMVLPPGSGGEAPAAGLDPTVVGPGLVRVAIPALQIAGALSVLAAVLLVRRWRSIGGLETWRDMGRGALLIGLVVAPAALLLQPPLRDYGGSRGVVLGADVLANPAVGSESPEVRYITAERNSPFIIFFDIANGSALPVTLEGIVVPDTGPDLSTRWTSLALASDRTIYPNRLDLLRPFTPQVIEPNTPLTVFLVGRAGSCAFGPTFTLDSPVTSTETLDRNLQLSYSILGLASTSTFTIPYELVQPDGPRCD